jgi:hypothetical protein
MIDIDLTSDIVMVVRYNNLNPSLDSSFEYYYLLMRRTFLLLIIKFRKHLIVKR